jgi:hypothetical protein
MVLADRQHEILRAYDFRKAKRLRGDSGLFPNQPSTFGGGELEAAIKRELDFEIWSGRRRTAIRTANPPMSHYSYFGRKYKISASAQLVSERVVFETRGKWKFSYTNIRIFITGETPTLEAGCAVSGSGRVEAAFFRLAPLVGNLPVRFSHKRSQPEKPPSLRRPSKKGLFTASLSS